MCSWKRQTKSTDAIASIEFSSFLKINKRGNILWVSQENTVYVYLRCVCEGILYGNLYRHVSTTLDRDLNRSVSQQQTENISSPNKSDLILDCALDGSVGLLKKWPDLRNHLHVFLNQPLPENLRLMAWRLFLEDTKC